MNEPAAGRPGNVRTVRASTPHRQALDDAQEQQGATAEVLRALARSPGDAQPVFDTIAAQALRLCRARSAYVSTYDGALLHIAALAIVDPQGIAAIRSIFPRPASRDNAACRAVLTREIAVIPDVLADPDFIPRHASVSAGFRSVVGVPLLRDGEPIGAIAVGRAAPGPFPASQIALLRTFAEQAVMAIENTRRFAEREARNRELAEALEQQAATSEILRVISRMPNDAQPVFEAIVARRRAAVSRRRGGDQPARRRHGVPTRDRRGRPRARGALAQGVSVPAVARVHPRRGDPRLPRGRCARRARDRRPVRGRQAQSGAVGLSRDDRRAAGARRRRDRRDRRRSHDARRADRQADHAAADLRRPGGDRDREHAPVQRDEGGTGAPDGDLRSAARHQRLGDRYAAGLRRHRRTRGSR